MQDLVALLCFPTLAAIIFVGMHTWLGLHVLRRKVVFADLALAQLSALGGTLAVAAGHAPGSLAGFLYALLLTFFGAGILTLCRQVARQVSQEAVIGILYVVATSVTVLIVDRSPQGAEHVKRMLVGNILTIGPDDVIKLAILYGAVGLIHVVFRRQLLAATEDALRLGGGRGAAWDILFYCTFGLVVTSSVALAGVLLVFSFLIMPAVIGTLFSPRMSVSLAVGWSAGVVASVLGFAASIAWDAPTGATMVTTFAGVLLCAAGLRMLVFSPALVRRRNRRRTAFVLAVTVTGAVLAQGVWLLIQPSGDQPLLALIESRLGFGPELFLTVTERRVFVEAAEAERRHRAEVERLRDVERDARWQTQGLSEDEVRRIGSFQQTFNEMGRGERYVQDHLRTSARMRARWILGVPAICLATLLMILLLRSAGRILRRRVGEEAA